jgi:hypothetical protein
MTHLKKLIREGNRSTLRSHLLSLCSAMNIEPYYVDKICRIPMGNGLNLLVDFFTGMDGGFIFMLPLCSETILLSKKALGRLAKRNAGLTGMEWRVVQEIGIIVWTDLPFTITLDDFRETIGRLTRERNEALMIPEIEDECLLFAEEIEDELEGSLVCQRLVG